MNLENQIIGTLLRFPDSIIETTVQPEWFEDANLGMVLTLMRGLAAEGKKADPVAIGLAANNHPLIGQLSQLWKDTVTAVENLPTFTGLLRERYRARQLSAVLDGAKAGLREGGSVDSTAGDVIQKLSALGEAERKWAYDSGDLMRQSLEAISDAEKVAEHGGIVGVTTGIPLMDDLLGGWHKSDLVILAGRPAMGKTAFMISSAYAAAAAGHSIGIVSAEMPAVQLGLRLASQVAGISNQALRSCRLKPNEWPKLTDATRALANLPFYVYDKPGCSITDVSLQATAWAISKKIEVLFIDYLTRLDPDKPDGNRVREVGEMVRSLKTLAKSLNIPVVCLAQLSRSCEQRPDKRPMMSDLRDSGEIEQEADVIAFTYRDCVYNERAAPDEADIIVEKNRHGPCANIPCTFIGETMRWSGRDQYVPDMREPLSSFYGRH